MVVSFVFTGFFLSLIFLFLVFFLSSGNSSSVFVKSSPFECGFSPFMNMLGESFSMPFFIISLLFLLFDVEIIIMCFPPFVGGGFVGFYWLVVFLVLLCTYYEWVSGVLSWVFS